jgi:hypothetical protein
MKKLLLFLFVLSFVTIINAQTDTTNYPGQTEPANPQGQTANRPTTPSPDLTNCIQQIYNNPEAIKLLMKTMMADHQNMQRIHSQLKNDPEMRQMMMQMRSMMDQDMHHRMEDGHGNQMRDTDGNMQRNQQQMQSDTTRVN